MRLLANQCSPVRERVLIAMLLLSLSISAVSVVIRLSQAQLPNPASMSLSTASTTITTNIFTVTLSATANEPVNTFAGILQFDPSVLSIELIDYSNSFIDLWAESPTYKNDQGTIHFAGGTTKPGGFIGNGELFTITFATHTIGTTTIGLNETYMLLHDGYGTPVSLDTPTDIVLNINPIINRNTISNTSSSNTKTTITTDQENIWSDLNKDGVYSFADIGVFMEYFNANDLRGDFDQDGQVTEKDLELLKSN